MSVQVSCSTYREEFGAPARGKPARPRPSSAHRRNNPHPRPDFLLPRRLQTGYGARQMVPAQTAVEYGSRFFPPLRHLSLPGPEGRPASLLLWPGSVDRPAVRMPALSSAHRSLSPSTGQLCKPEPVDSPLRERLFQNSPSKNTEGKMEPHKSCMQSSNGYLKGTQCFHSDVQPRVGQGDRGISGCEVLKASKRPDNPTLARYPKPQMYFKKSHSTLDPSSVYSCFQVVKPYKAGYYIIHPEFISESLK